MMTTSVELSATFSLEVETLASMALRGLALIGHGDSSDTPFALSMEVSLKVSGGVVLYRSASAHLRRRVEFQWFFIALSVLPSKSFAIDAHLFPWTA